jgi:lysyl-tRNA synthetase class 2
LETESTEHREIRLEKLARLRELGVDPYPSGYRWTHAAAQARAAFAEAGSPEETEGPVVRCAGRIMLRRPMGKATFMTFEDASGRMQVYFRQDVVGGERYEVVGLLDIGDIIGFEGPLFLTKTGELTIKVTDFTVLAKSLRPLPDKWAGLRDKEARYRQRYLDLIMNTGAREVFVKRAMILRGIREFLTGKGYVEVETPTLEVIYGGALAKPFVTRWHALGIDVYMRIAMELHLKRLITGGFYGVFEMGKDFRNEGIDATHYPEFTQMEVNIAYFTYFDMMDLVEEMIASIARDVCGTTKITYSGREVDLTPPWRRIRFDDAAKEHLGIENASSLPPERIKEIQDEIEPSMIDPTIVYDLPTSVSPLAKARADNPLVTERFELIISGMEFANSYSELNDPVDQYNRFAAQLAERDAGDEEAHMMDEDFIVALEHGMPPNAGLGVGIDRVVMLLTDQPSIRDVILFPAMRPK